MRRIRSSGRSELAARSINAAAGAGAARRLSSPVRSRTKRMSRPCSLATSRILAVKKMSSRNATISCPTGSPFSLAPALSALASLPVQPRLVGHDLPGGTKIHALGVGEEVADGAGVDAGEVLHLVAEAAVDLAALEELAPVPIEAVLDGLPQLPQRRRPLAALGLQLQDLPLQALGRVHHRAGAV